MKTPLYMIAAITADRALGNQGQLIFRDKNDMEHFKDTTMGHVVVMGRKTWDSLPDKFKPLPGRINVILTRNIDSVGIPDEYIKNGTSENNYVSVFYKNLSQDNLIVNPIIITSDKDFVLSLSKAYANLNKKTYVMGGGQIYSAFKDSYTEIVLTEASWESQGCDTKLFELDDTWTKDTRRCRKIVMDDKHLDFNYYIKANNTKS